MIKGELKRTLLRDCWVVWCSQKEECAWPQMGIFSSRVAGRVRRSFIAVVSHSELEKKVKEDLPSYTSDFVCRGSEGSDKI